MLARKLKSCFSCFVFNCDVISGSFPEHCAYKLIAVDEDHDPVPLQPERAGQEQVQVLCHRQDFQSALQVVYHDVFGDVWTAKKMGDRR